MVRAGTRDRKPVRAGMSHHTLGSVGKGSAMTVIERLYDNAWYVANASPTARDQLAAAVTRAWMEREAAVSDATRARSVSGVSPARSALALSIGNTSQAAYDRARSRAAEAARCTDIIGGHAFSVRREAHPQQAMTVEVASCTLLRRASLSVSRRGEEWYAVLHDPQDRKRPSFTTTLGTDPWAALHQACDWIVSGQF